MQKAVDDIVPKESGWIALHDQQVSVKFPTREGAFEVAVAAAEQATAEGYEVHLSVVGGLKGRFA